MQHAKQKRPILYRLRTGVNYYNSSSTRRRKIMAASMVFLILIVGIGVKVIASPVHGREVPVDQRTPLKTTKAAPVLPASDVQSNYFSLALPAGYKPQTAESVPGLLYSQTITKPSLGGTMIVSIAVKATPDGGLDGDPSYRLRQSKPAQYRQKSQTINGNTVTIFNDAESASVVAFMLHGSTMATVSVTLGISNPSSNDNEDEIKVLQPILAAWQWQ